MRAWSVMTLVLAGRHAAARAPRLAPAAPVARAVAGSAAGRRAVTAVTAVMALTALMAVMALMAGVAACGYGPQESFTGKRHADGISPWQDLGAVELCLANRRIGPPDSPVGGRCVDRNAPPDPPCVSDLDCASRERCVCGRCTIQYCSTSEECGPGRICSFAERRCDVPCFRDDDCTGDREVCLGNVCRRRCSVSAECQTGEVCSSQGRCIVASCSRDGDCLEGEVCRVQREPRATHEPTVLPRPNDAPPGAPRLTLWLEMSNETGTQRAIWRAVSDDGLSFRFDPASPVVEAAGFAGAPSAIRQGTLVRLYYETADGIFAAESADDGRTFGMPTRVLAGDVHAPGAVAAPDGEIWLFVHEGDRQGIALSRGGGPPTTVLRPADATHPDLWRDVERLGSPHAAIDASPLGEPVLRLWFDGFGAESGPSEQFGEIVPIPPNDSIGFASTLASHPTGLVLWPWNPVLDRTVAFLEHRAERSPAVVLLPDAGTWLLYYVGAKADGTASEGLRVARNPPRH